MKNDKVFLRKLFLSKRKKNYFTSNRFNFNLVFQLIKKHFKERRIIIAGYYPSDYEVNILEFLEKAQKKKFKILLPVIESSKNISFKLWGFKEPLYINNFGIL